MRTMKNIADAISAMKFRKKIFGGVDENADTRPKVGRVEFEKIEQPDGTARKRFDDEPQLACGIDVEALFVEKPLQRVTGEGCQRTADSPYRRVVLPSVQQVEIVGFERPQTDAFPFYHVYGWYQFNHTLTD